MPMRNTLWTVMGACLIGGALLGCDGGGEATQGGAAPSAAAKKAASAQAKLATTMVSAVSSGGGTVPVDVKFELLQRPEVGQAASIAFAFIPVAPLDRLYARFQPDDSLEVVSGSQTEQFARPAVGEPVPHTLVVRPKRDGVFAVQVTVLMDSETESLSRVFSVPLIAGSGVAEPLPKTVAARADDSG
jgi:hypothetical protein